MAAIQGDWYASVGTHNGDAYLDGNGAVRFVYATQESGAKYIVAKVWSGVDGDYASTARLVAAAPDLLAACKELHNCLSDWVEIADSDDLRDGDMEAIKLSVAAIAKAEGRE